MWENFIVDDYSPKPNYKTLIPKAVESKPRVTVPEPFQMTLREEERRLKPRQASMVVSVEPQKPPQFKANPIPLKSRLCVYQKSLQECEKQREIRHDKRKKFLLALQRPFSAGDAKPAEEKFIEPTTEKSTFRPLINTKVPDSPKLHHMFEDRLKNIRQKRQPTVPQPFSFQVSDQVTSTTKRPLKSIKWQGDSKKSVSIKAKAGPPRPTKSALLREETVRREMRAHCAEYQVQLAEMMERVQQRPLMLQSLDNPATQEQNFLMLEYLVIHDVLDSS
ncbi:protein FAM161A-like [Clupea harengus]|uniref:Protein FAM161A-like n=1 Tax=Clupea harengus TaxID=7950 RepID=A0A8M1KRZ4_CLUHA|nr:protein FAM161A-like [Clupea harengus]